MNVRWPNRHRFAFTIFDDTDYTTLDNVHPVYELLVALGMRITKSAWVFRGDGVSRNGGATCEDQEYLDGPFSLRQRGLEIGLHNVAPSTSSR